MNKWKQAVTPEVKEIFKKIRELDKIDKDAAYLIKVEDTIPKAHLKVLKQSYYTALKTQLLSLNQSLDEWTINGCRVSDNEYTTDELRSSLHDDTSN